MIESIIIIVFDIHVSIYIMHYDIIIKFYLIFQLIIVNILIKHVKVNEQLTKKTIH